MKHVGILVLLAFAPAANTAELNFDYLEAGYLRGQVDEPFLHADFDGWELRGGLEHNDWLLVGGYEELTVGPITAFDTLEIRFITSFLRIGGGYRFMLGERFALAPSAGLLRGSEKRDLSGFCEACDITEKSNSDRGYFVNLDFRARLTDGLEAEFEHRFTNVFGERLNDWRLDLRYDVTTHLALSVGYRDYEDETATGITARWNF